MEVFRQDCSTLASHFEYNIITRTVVSDPHSERLPQSNLTNLKEDLKSPYTLPGYED